MNFKALALITSLAIITSCGKEASEPTPHQPPATNNASIFSRWVAVDPDTALHDLVELDFSNLDLDQNIEYQGCNGSYGNSGLVNGVAEGFYRFSGTTDNGGIQFGHQAYVSAADPVCREISKESYTYKITGSSLRLCMVNYPFCADYSLAD